MTASISNNESNGHVVLVSIDSLWLRQNSRQFPHNILKCIFLNENIWILINISLKFIPKCPINNIPALVQIMAWRQPGNKPLSEPMIVSLLAHICVTQPQWVNGTISWCHIFHSSPPSAAYMRQWIRSALVHVMASHLLGAQPLSKPMVDYCQLDP